MKNINVICWSVIRPNSGVCEYCGGLGLCYECGKTE